MLRNIAARLCLAAGLLALGAGAVRADQLDDIRKAGVVRVATDLSLPPFGTMDGGMQPTGSDVETARELAAHLGVKLDVVPTTAPARVPSLQTGKADLVISSLAVTPERARVVDFSNIYAVLRVVIAGPKDEAVKTLEDLKGRSVGLARGTTQDGYLSQNAKDARVVRYEDEATAAQAYVSGQVDFLSTAELFIPEISARMTSRKPEVKLIVRTSLLGIAVRKGETRLLGDVNGWIKASLADGKLNAIYKKYHGSDLPDEVIQGRAN